MMAKSKRADEMSSSSLPVICSVTVCTVDRILVQLGQALLCFHSVLLCDLNLVTVFNFYS